MNRNVGIIDATFRDGQQSLWATRMTTAMMLPALETLDQAGFQALDIWGTAMMDAAVRFLKENPWEKLRLIQGRIRRSPIMMIIGCLGFVVGRGAAPDDVLALLYKLCADNGVDQFFAMDGLNDMRNFTVPMAAARAAGKEVVGAVVYSISPVHTDAHFVAKTRELVTQGVDAVVLKDPNGVLTPERVRTLVPAMIAAAGAVPVYCHSHCLTGLGPATNLAAIEHGARAIWTCSRPLANGSSLPATESMLRHLERMGYRAGLDRAGLTAIESYVLQVAARHQKPLGRPAEYDPALYAHQVPGGMISNFRAQLAQLGIGHLLEEVLAEIPSVRADLGWPCMVTPFSQIVGTQAALNVLYGRYRVVIVDIEKLALGYFGHTPAPVDPNILDQVGKGRQPIQERPAAGIPPAVARFRRERGPFASDEDLLLAYLFMPDQLQTLQAAGPIATEDRLPLSPLVELVRDVARRRNVRSLRLVVPR